MRLGRWHVGLAVGLIAAFCMVTRADAVQTYVVSGQDSVAIGSAQAASDVVYAGTETLTFDRAGDAMRYVARVAYVRSGQGAKTQGHASFISLLGPTGEQRDEHDDDPDYLTVLNQPFAVQLDQATIRAVAKLKEPQPFVFPLPMTGGALQGSLRNGGDAIVAGERTLGIVFEAEGPMTGTVPGRAGLTLNGRIRMHGTAYYAYATALLQALDTRLEISGALAQTGDSRPVRILYRRTIRAVRPPVNEEAARTTVP